MTRFLRHNQVEAVAVRHVGPGMQRMLGSMAIRVVDGLGGDAQRGERGWSLRPLAAVRWVV